MTKLALIRHGQSQWNLENRFTGWVDVDLTAEGEAQARRSGELLKAEEIPFERAYTSVLTRAIRTCWLALFAMDMVWIPVVNDWRLNERHYGGLTGLDKAETEREHGPEQVRIWRRSYDVAPPPTEKNSPYDLSGDRRYRNVTVPATESLATTLQRVLPYWRAEIAPRISEGEHVIVAAHGNSLRAIVKHLFAVADADIVHVEIPTGNPLLIDLDEALRPRSARYLDAGRAQELPVLSPASA